MNRKTIRAGAAAAITLALACGLPMPSAASNSWGTDMSDLWWNPNESGWGANIVHQQEVIFMTLFVYGADSRVKWYVGSDLRSQGGSLTFSGPLYETTGPFLAGAFNPANVVARQVGTATLVLLAESGTLTYSVDGATVTKQIERQTFRIPNLSGAYKGNAFETAVNCGRFSGDNEMTVEFTITQAGSDVRVVADYSNGLLCTYTGTYTGTGHLGRIEGTNSCGGSTGTFRFGEIEASRFGFFATSDGSSGACASTGRLSGLKR